MAYFSTIEAGIIGGLRLVGVGGSSLEILVFSFSPFLVFLSAPIDIQLTKVHSHWLVVHAR